MRITINRRLLFLSLSMTLFAVWGTAVVHGQNNARAEGEIRLNRVVPTACQDKRIQLSGRVQAQYSVTRDPGGDMLLGADLNADGIGGAALRSANKYVAKGTDHFDSRGPSPTSFNIVFNFALNKVGSTDSMMAHVKLRINVDKTGAVTTDVIGVDIDCVK